MLNKKQIALILGQIFFWSLVVFALGIIYCIRENYTPPLLFLGLVNTSNELNMKVVGILISFGFLALLAEMLFVFFYIRFLKKVRYDHIISLMTMLLLITANKLGLSGTDAVVIGLLCLLWFYLRLFTLDGRSKDFSHLFTKRMEYREPEIIKNRKDDQTDIILTFVIISTFCVIPWCFLSKDKAIQNFDKDLFLLTNIYAALIIFVWLALCNRYSSKYRYTRKQTIPFIGTYNELVDKLFQFDFSFHRQIENYISFYHKTLFLPKQTILVRKEANQQYSITGQVTIIKHLERDLNNKDLKEVKTSNVLGLSEC